MANTPTLKVMAIILAAALIAGCQKKQRGSGDLSIADLQLLITRNHFSPPTETQMGYALVAGLDGYSHFDHEPHACGIGVTFSPHLVEDSFVITAVDKQSGASHAGLRPGDRLIEIQGKPVLGASVGDVVRLLSGKRNTSVELLVFRHSEGVKHKVSAVRAPSEPDSIDSLWEDGRSSFARVTAVSNEAAQSIRQSLDKNPSLLILDLRTCTSGQTDALGKLAGLFLPPGSLVAQYQSAGGKKHSIRTEDTSQWTGRLFVLISRHTQLDGKVLAHALTRRPDTTLVGETCNSRALAFEDFRWNSRILRLATSAMMDPDGVNIDKMALEPSLSIPLSSEELVKLLDDRSVIAQVRPDDVFSTYGFELQSDQYLSAIMAIPALGAPIVTPAAIP